MLENRMIMTQVEESIEAAKERRRPVCGWCGYPIWDDKAVHYHNRWICTGCLDFWTEYIEEERY